MDEFSIREALQNFVRQFVNDFRLKGDDIEIYRTRRDDFNSGHPDRVSHLPAFESVVTSLDASPRLQGRYPPNAGRYLTQRFSLLFLSASDTLVFDQTVFDDLWTEFWSELVADQWIYRAVAILYNFECEPLSIDLGDGISILSLRDNGTVVESLRGMVWYPQVSDDIARDLRLGRWQVDELNRDALNAMHGHHVIVATHSSDKTPEVSVNTPRVMEKLNRALLSLRMLKEGDIGNGPVYEQRVATFYYAGGLSSLTETTGSGRNHARQEYELLESEVEALQRLYQRIEQFDKTQALIKPVWHNVAVAARAFNSTYRRGFFGPEDVILDAITAVEALVIGNTSGEFAFRLAFRASSMLANTDDERSQLFDEFKQFYDTRSKIVHGDVLKPKHLDDVENRARLRSLVRRLLKGFMNLATRESWSAQSINTFYEGLDTCLLHSRQRTGLRDRMGGFASD